MKEKNGKQTKIQHRERVYWVADQWVQHQPEGESKKKNENRKKKARTRSWPLERGRELNGENVMTDVRTALDAKTK